MDEEDAAEVAFNFDDEEELFNDELECFKLPLEIFNELDEALRKEPPPLTNRLIKDGSL